MLRTAFPAARASSPVVRKLKLPRFWPGGRNSQPGNALDLHPNSGGTSVRQKPRHWPAWRHPNVASVFHLGRTGSSYFYAMEFVEGETLEHLIRRSGRVEVKLALVSRTPSCHYRPLSGSHSNSGVSKL
jgi:hypothetical protein